MIFQVTGVSANMPYLYIFQEFTLTDDTVLEEHYEDPRLTQMLLIGDGGNTPKVIVILFQKFVTYELLLRMLCVKHTIDNRNCIC